MEVCKMENEQYLIAANSKRGRLIFSIFRKVDLYIAITGAVLTIILFMIFQPDSLWLTVVVLLPLLFCSFLVIPIPNYHNVLCVLQNIYHYLVDPQEYKWKGWCCKNEFK